MGSTIVMLVIMVAVFYFMLIRPENKRKKEAEDMRSSVKEGDEITTIGGIVGKVVNVKDDKIVIETSADQVRIEMNKWAISTNESILYFFIIFRFEDRESHQAFHSSVDVGLR